MSDEDGPDMALRKLTQQPGVAGYVVLSKTGVPVKFHNMENSKALQYAALVSELTISTREFLQKRLFKPEEDDTELRTLRLRTRKHEIVICPDDNFTLVVLHHAGASDAARLQEEAAAAAAAAATAAAAAKDGEGETVA